MVCAVATCLTSSMLNCQHFALPLPKECHVATLHFASSVSLVGVPYLHLDCQLGTLRPRPPSCHCSVGSPSMFRRSSGRCSVTGVLMPNYYSFWRLTRSLHPPSLQMTTYALSWRSSCYSADAKSGCLLREAFRLRLPRKTLKAWLGCCKFAPRCAGCPRLFAGSSESCPAIPRGSSLLEPAARDAHFESLFLSTACSATLVC